MGGGGGVTRVTANLSLFQNLADEADNGGRLNAVVIYYVLLIMLYNVDPDKSLMQDFLNDRPRQRGGKSCQL